ncbi:EAL domain-containing protein [Burkholderia sp. Bp8998]|uniref:EAL domain-containing protein n=1 Tax=Burkholderia sp. Bp8998 TaxID=2184557 RepID=UPI001639FAC2|nr:EAL domain-containing protein [Burkholderia sp. Bp8998]
MGSALLIKVVNRPALIGRFGRTFMEAIDLELGERAQQLCGEGARVWTTGDGHLLISEMVSRAGFEGRSETNFPTASWLLRLSGRRKPHSQAAWLADLRARWVGDGVTPVTEARRGRSGAEVLTRADLEIAGTVLRAMKDDEISLVMSPVYASDDTRKVLYFTCTTWCRAFDDGKSAPSAYLPSIARTGLMRYFDRYVLKRVLDLLRLSPELSIGVSLSGQSLVDGLQWEDLLDQLYASPDVAARLVVEVAECAEIEARGARAFIARLKALGCRIAIDEYGLAYGIGVGMAIPDPDIVKIAPKFIAAARRNDHALGKLRRLAGLAESIAREVVVSGANGDTDLEIVRNIGAGWVQGY